MPRLPNELFDELVDAAAQDHSRARRLLSEHPDAFGGWKLVTIEEFQKYMQERYGVTYGPQGEWMHIPPGARD